MAVAEDRGLESVSDLVVVVVKYVQRKMMMMTTMMMVYVNHLSRLGLAKHRFVSGGCAAWSVSYVARGGSAAWFFRYTELSCCWRIERWMILENVDVMGVPLD